MLTGEMPSETIRAKSSILFLLDELPRLKEMPPVARLSRLVPAMA